MFTMTNTTSAEQKQATDWKREEHVTIDVNNFSYDAFLVVLKSCYTGRSLIDLCTSKLTDLSVASPPSSHEFSDSAVQEALTFFQRYPRFTADERNRFLLSLAQSSDDNNNNNNNNRSPFPPFADVCIELPSQKREYCPKVT